MSERRTVPSRVTSGTSFSTTIVKGLGMLSSGGFEARRVSRAEPRGSGRGCVRPSTDCCLDEVHVVYQPVGDRAAEDVPPAGGMCRVPLVRAVRGGSHADAR